MGFARHVAERVAFIDEGQILEIGRPDQGLGAPREPRTWQFLEMVLEN